MLLSSTLPILTLRELGSFTSSLWLDADFKIKQRLISIIYAHIYYKKQGEFKVPINPKIFFCFEKSLYRSEKNGAKIFVFGSNRNFLRIFKVWFSLPATG